MKIGIEIIGWIGSLEILIAYALNSYQKIKSDSLPFLALNIKGGVLLTFYSYQHEAFPNSFLNIVWVAVAIPVLVKTFSRKKKQPQ